MLATQRNATIQPKGFYPLSVPRLHSAAVRALKSGPRISWKALDIAPLQLPTSSTDNCFLVSRLGYASIIKEKGWKPLVLPAFMLGNNGSCFTSEIHFLHIQERKPTDGRARVTPCTCFFLWGFGIQFSVFDFPQSWTSMKLAEETISALT